MTDLDLHAVKARAKAVIKDNRQDTPEERTALVLAAQTLEVIAEVHRLRDLCEITDDMIERAALAIAEVDEWPTNEELGGGPTGTRDDEFRDEYIDMARAALEAALGEDHANAE